MSNRRVKSLAVDDDDYDDYDEYDEGYDGGDGEVSVEDQEQLRIGTVKVREALGSAYQVSDQEIQDALWNYYYDIAKSVTYLKNAHKPKSKSSGISQSTCYPRHQSAKEFFIDCPWLRIPEHRRAEILVEPIHPRGGLLGGASKDGKMSKLAALRAKRQKENFRPPEASNQDAGQESDYAANLNKLTLGNDSARERRRKADNAAHTTLEQQGDKNSTAGSQNQVVDDSTGGVVQESAEEATVAVRTTPSAFATTIMSPKNSVSLSTSLNLGFGFPGVFDFKEPSPDDVVYRAQTGKPPPATAINTKSTTKSKLKDPVKTAATVTNGVANLSIQEPTKIKSKNLDVLAEYKQVKRKNAANFVVIGHVDAGKSTLMGRLLFDLKAVDQRTMDRYKKEADQIGKGSFAFAWVLDHGTEERERGVTIDISQNKFDTEKTSFTILDAPGHRDFVPNMIAGASQADFAVLVIDASTGNFESGLRGQTREHALLAKSIGVQRLIVAVNKMDTVSWSQDRFDDIKNQMTGFLRAAHFQPSNVKFVPCSGLEGGNILTHATTAAASWYKGPTLVELLDESEPISHNIEKPLRMTVADVFRGGVQNPLSVSGRIEAGNLQVGEQIVIMPSGENAQIKGIDVDDSGNPQDWAVAGQNVILHLTDIDPIHLRSGDVVCNPGNSPIKNIQRFTAQLLAFNHLTPMLVDVHRGRLHVPGRISQLLATLDKRTGEIQKRRPKIVQPETLVRVVIELDHAVPLEAPARVVLRANGETVAAGLIE